MHLVAWAAPEIFLTYKKTAVSHNYRFDGNKELGPEDFGVAKTLQHDATLRK